MRNGDFFLGNVDGDYGKFEMGWMIFGANGKLIPCKSCIRLFYLNEYEVISNDLYSTLEMMEIYNRLSYYIFLYPAASH